MSSSRFGLTGYDCHTEHCKTSWPGVDAHVYHYCDSGRSAVDRTPPGREDEPGGQRHIPGSDYRSGRHRPDTGLRHPELRQHSTRRLHDYGRLCCVVHSRQSSASGGYRGQRPGPFHFRIPYAHCPAHSRGCRSCPGCSPGHSHLSPASESGESTTWCWQWRPWAWPLL